MVLSSTDFFQPDIVERLYGRFGCRLVKTANYFVFSEMTLMLIDIAQ
jgi:hypothetical protein